MKWTSIAVVVFLSVASRAADLSKELAVLDGDKNSARLEAAAIAIAQSEDPAAIGGLAKHFAERSFLLRLDPARGPEAGVVHLGNVFRALAEHPSQASASLCLALANNREFGSVPARLNYLLNALAAVRPMSQAAANVFAATSRSGYLEVNGPPLARNGSPEALRVLAELLADDSLDVAQRVSVAHWSLLPQRANSGVVSMCARLLNAGGFSHPVETAILESLFDYQPRSWFGLAAGQPAPPDWKLAPAETRSALVSLGKSALQRGDLPPVLRAAIQNTIAALSAPP